MKEKTNIKAPPNPNHTFYVRLDQEGRVWNGFAYLDEKKKEWVSIFPELSEKIPELEGLDKVYVNQHFDSQGNIWMIIDLYYKVVRYNLETQDLKVYPIKGSTFSDGQDDRFYLNAGSDLVYYDVNQDSFLQLSAQEKWSALSLFTADYKDESWIANPKGLLSYNWNTRSFFKPDFHDGYPKVDYNNVRRAVIDEFGNVVFDVNMKEFYSFNINSLQLNDDQTKVHLEDFFINNKIIKPDDSAQVLEKNLPYLSELNLTYKQSSFGFSFSYPLFYRPDDIQYYYQLYPYHKEWQNNGFDKNVNFTNISPGTYTFKVKAQSISGVWSENEASIKLIINPPWWKTSWAYLAYGIIFLGGIYSLQKFNLKRQIEKQHVKQLKELDQLKNRFFTNITHEFRTPLTVISGLAGELKERSKGKIIIRNSQNLLRLINQILDLSKLDAQSLKVSWVEGDIIQYLKYITESFYSLAKEKNIKLVFYTELDRLQMAYDEEKIQQVIFNLLSNALKFTEAKGQVILNIREVESEKNSKLQIKVSDTGIGIPAAQVPYLFDRFYQVDSSVSRKGEGTGIGLALTKDLVELMEGSIDVESQEGKGSHFTVLLPIIDRENIQKPNLQNIQGLEVFIPQKSNSSNDQVLLNSMANKILIVEDNKDVSNYLSDLLSESYTIIQSDNGDDGINQALENIPDLIISDLMMPKKNGFELCEILKKDEKTNHIPIILLTAKAENESKIKGLQLGADAYLYKPFNKKELFTVVENLIKIRQQLQSKYQTPSSKIIQKVKPNKEDRFIQSVLKIIEDHIHKSDFSVATISEELQLSPTQFYRKLKAISGQTPTIFIRNFKLQKAYELLKEGDLNVSEVAYEVGFSDPAYFSRVFKEKFSLTPVEVLNS